MIPKKLHFIWVGDQSKRPDNCIATWRAFHPGWEIRVWSDDDLRDREWVNGRHMTDMYGIELNGVADMMRWEILYAEGGIVLDADSVCVHPLDEALLDCAAFACWENEMVRPGLIAAGYFGSCAENPFVGQIILDIQQEATVIDRMAWETVGPQRLTDAYRKYQYHGLRIHPSHYFIPVHFTGVAYEGPGPIYAHQLWGSTNRIYDQIHLEQFIPADAAPITPTARPAAPPAASSVASPTTSIAARHDPDFVQKVQVSSELTGVGRLDVFKALCGGKRVLHIGCADRPAGDPATSLHLALEPHCVQLDGFDSDEEALDALRPFTRGRLFSRFEDIADEYDIVLVPEVMAHVPRVGDFLAALDAIRAKFFLITVRDAFQSQQQHFEYGGQDETFVEVVHPDHVCWYTPFTFANTLGRHTDWRMEKMWFFDAVSLLALMSKPERLAQAA